MRSLILAFCLNQTLTSVITPAAVSKAKQRLFQIFKVFSLNNTPALVKAYQSYVLPLLEYCSPVWNPTAVGDILSLESVQRYFSRRLCSQFVDSTYIERLTKLGIKTLEYRRLVADLVLFYKLIHKK